jgi:hypothetical protein
VAASEQVPAQAMVQMEPADARCCEDDVAHAVAAIIDRVAFAP